MDVVGNGEKKTMIKAATQIQMDKIHFTRLLLGKTDWALVFVAFDHARNIDLSLLLELKIFFNRPPWQIGRMSYSPSLDVTRNLI